MRIVEGSFIAVVCKDSRPYEGYPHVSEAIQDMVIPTILMVNRWDGKIGFPGGTVEEGESAIEAAIREAYEEIGLELDESNLEFISTNHYQDERIDLTAHLFAFLVDYNEMKDICHNMLGAEHFGSEITGCVIVQCANNKKGGYNEFLKNNFPLTAKEQLKILTEKYELLNTSLL